MASFLSAGSFWLQLVAQRKLTLKLFLNPRNHPSEKENSLLHGLCCCKISLAQSLNHHPFTYMQNITCKKSNHAKFSRVEDLNLADSLAYLQTFSSEVFVFIMQLLFHLRILR